MLREYIDLNNMTLFGVEDVCSTVSTFSADQSMLHLEGTFNVANPGGWKLVAADKHRRFLNVGTTDEDGNWKLALDMDRLKNLPKDGPLVLYGLRPGANQLYPVTMTDGVHDCIRARLDEVQTVTVAEVPSYREQYIKDIVEATKMRYVSTSIESNIITGNNYQSIEIERTLREGARSDRNTYLQQVDFRGKSVLDIGANTGEMSRAVRLLGADLVDGVEYDSFFVETGRMINGVVGATRVSLFQGDATHPGFYKDKKYDMVVALSVFVYIKERMAELAEMTDVLVFETHTLDHGLKMYLDAVTPHFPVYQHVGYSQMKDRLRKSRAFIIFAKDQKSLDSAFKPKSLKIGSYFKNSFIEEHGSTTPAAFLDWAGALRDKLDLQKLETQPLGFGSSTYFATYIMGYLQYLENGSTVSEDNIFVRRYVDAINSGNLDGNLKPVIQDMDNVLLKVTGKFRDFDYCLAGDFYKVPLIYLALEENGKMSFEDVDGSVLKAGNIDGHHRYFLAQLLGIETMMYMTSDSRPKFSDKIDANYSLKH